MAMVTERVAGDFFGVIVEHRAGTCDAFCYEVGARRLLLSSVSGETPATIRDAIYSDYQDYDDMAILCGVDCFSEAIDFPAASAVFIASSAIGPTGAPRFLQRCFRVTRLDPVNPGKAPDVLLWTDGDSEDRDNALSVLAPVSARIPGVFLTRWPTAIQQASRWIEAFQRNDRKPPTDCHDDPQIRAAAAWLFEFARSGYNDAEAARMIDEMFGGTEWRRHAGGERLVEGPRIRSVRSRNGATSEGQPCVPRTPPGRVGAT